jgi:hypothetical protein
MAKASWQEHFKASIKNAENLYSKDSPPVSLLLFCLRSKMIPIQTYLDWAKENYQLPVLSEKYFQVHKPQQEFYKKWQNTYNWSAECLPITEWDGSLIVACLQMPDDYKQTTNSTVFVLTSHEFLDSTWSSYQKSSSASNADFTDMTSLVATVVATTENAKFFGADGELILQDDVPKDETLEQMSDDGSDNAGSKEGESGSPEGLFGDIPTPNEASFGSTKTASVLLKPMNTEVTKEIQITPLLPPTKSSTLGETPVKKGPRSVQPLMMIQEDSVDEKSSIDESMEDLDELNAQKVISPAAQVAAGTGDFPSAPVKLTTDPRITEAYLLEKMRKQGQDLFDKVARESFQKLKPFFEKSMLLAIGDQDRQLKPIVWDSGFDNQKSQIPQQNSEFDLKTPSIFKIVTGTQKPYHGMVVVNDLNESFFESWNNGQIPDHVTIVPLFDGDLVVGMLMGFGAKSSYNKNVLHFTENVAKDLSQRIYKKSTSKAA